MDIAMRTGIWKLMMSSSGVKWRGRLPKSNGFVLWLSAKVVILMRGLGEDIRLEHGNGSQTLQLAQDTMRESRMICKRGEHCIHNNTHAWRWALSTLGQQPVDAYELRYDILVSAPKPPLLAHVSVLLFFRSVFCGGNKNHMCKF